MENYLTPEIFNLVVFALLLIATLYFFGKTIWKVAIYSALAILVFIGGLLLLVAVVLLLVIYLLAMFLILLI